MVKFTNGNVLDADVEALVNTVNTIGVMGKGIALMFKERYPDNYAAYAAACRKSEVRIGQVFATRTKELFGPRWILNFPTKTHWKANSRLEWIDKGLGDLVWTIRDKRIRSIAVPPLGCGNGGLQWSDVKPMITAALSTIDGLHVVVYEPTAKYQNVVKRAGIRQLTAPRALMADTVRRYCQISTDCTILEVQKLGWFIDRGLNDLGVDNPMRFRFEAQRYGPYSHNLVKLLDKLDGSYLRCRKRLADATPRDFIWFDNEYQYSKDLTTYIDSMEKPFRIVSDWVTRIVKGFESAFGLELLASTDWLVNVESIEPTVDKILEGLLQWPAGEQAGLRKARLFDEYEVRLALDHLGSVGPIAAGSA